MIMSINLNELKTEIQTDPLALSLSFDAPQDTADKLNLVRPTIQINRTGVPALELQKAVVGAELVTLDAGKRDGWLMLMIIAAENGLDAADPAIVAQIQQIWQGTTTLTQLAALQTRDGSRAEQMWGEHANVTAKDVRDAAEI
jgi:hypothetical protein